MLMTTIKDLNLTKLTLQLPILEHDQVLHLHLHLHADLLVQDEAVNKETPELDHPA
jgi:hypothetical protein